MCEAPFVSGSQPVRFDYAIILIKNAANQGSGPLRFEVSVNQTILSALNSLAAQTKNEFLTKQPLVAVVNGMTTDMSYLLQPGDTVQCFPQIVGG